jgi:hypothetical protein
MHIIPKHNIKQLKKANKTFNKGNNITKRLKDINLPNGIITSQTLDRKVMGYADYVKNNNKYDKE